MSVFEKISDRKGTHIVEGEVKPGKVFSIKRFICKIDPQENEEDVEKIADMLLSKLNN